ncbi:secreted and transmembrane protein 1b-like [Peromyscus californicus insignis]|uniref:secreted and transmembrane protein 1b-like n=1 Tax=Peromyscus californicus insignis TaxID=564181 RepID=UPI0022A75C27|nr:secreted and transmembrane protein 1b-like [Peromyscus californicus insignis]
MLAYPITFTGPCPRTLWTLLLLVVSLNAHNQNWDNPRCTEVVSAPRGDCVEMSCNISNTFRDITIELTANGKTTTIFNKKPPGNYLNDSWQLQIQGGQAQLVITDAQDIHAGSYLWQLHGCQRRNMHLILNVTDLATANQDPESLQVSAEPPSAVSTEVIIILVFSIIIIGISAFAWYKHSHLPRCHRFEVPGPGLNHKFPGISYLTLPKISQVLPQKVLKEPY